MALQTSLGIDIAEDQLSLTCLRKTIRGIKILARGVYPISLAEKDTQRSDAIETCVERFLGEHRLAPEAVFIGLGEELVISRKLELPLAVKENLRGTLGYEMEKYVPLPPDEVCFDYQVISEDKDSKTLSLLLVVARRSEILSCCQVADRLKLPLSGIEMRTSALINFLTAAEGLDVDGVGALALVEANRLTISLVSGQRLIYSGIHVLDASKSNMAGAVSSIIQRFRHFLPEVEGPLPVWLAGSGADEKLFGELADIDAFDVRFPQRDSTEIIGWEMAVSYGLALKGMRQLPVQINLVPQGMRKRPPRIGYYMMLALTILTILAGASWAGSYALHQRQVQERLDAEIERLSTEIETVDKIQAETKRIEEWITYLNSMRRGGIPTLDILIELTERIPENAWVRDLNLNESEMRLDGYADSASELLPVLDESPYFRDVVFISTITKGKDGKERFRIGGKIEQSTGNGVEPK